MSDARFVVLFPGALGDLCLLAPALRAVTARGVRVELSVQRSLGPVATLLHPAIALGPPIDGRLMASLFAGRVASEVADWMAGASRVHAWLARAGAGGVLQSRFAALGVPAALHAVPRDDGGPHASEEYAAALGVAGALTVFETTPPAATSIALPWREEPSRRLVVHPGSGGRAKRWELDGFRRVVDGWRVQGGDATVLLGPAEDGDAPAWRSAGHEPLLGLSIVDAAALIASAPTWIGNDSGMSHLAGALGRRGVVVFRATRPERWRPLGGRLAAITSGDRSPAAMACEALAILGAPSAST